MILGHPISTGFRRLIGCQRDPRDSGVTFGFLMKELWKLQAMKTNSNIVTPTTAEATVFHHFMT